MSTQRFGGDPDRIGITEQYLEDGLYPVEAPPELTSPCRLQISRNEWQRLRTTERSASLRALAKKYRVSHETVRQMLLDQDGRPSQ